MILSNPLTFLSSCQDIGNLPMTHLPGSTKTWACNCLRVTGINDRDEAVTPYGVTGDSAKELCASSYNRSSVAFDAKFRRLLVKQVPAPDTVFVRSSIGQAATRTVPAPRGGTVPS